MGAEERGVGGKWSKSSFEIVVMVLFVVVRFLCVLFFVLCSFESMRALNGSDVRRERIPLLWSTVRRRSLFVVFETCASLSSCLSITISPGLTSPCCPALRVRLTLITVTGAPRRRPRSRGEDDAMRTGNWMSDPCR